VEVNVFFFFFHLTCARWRGSGLVFFVIFFFFIIEWLGKGGKVFLKNICLRGTGRGGG
jgi:hypothetical protein